MTQVAIIYEGSSAHITGAAETAARGAASVAPTRVLLIPLEGVQDYWQGVDDSQAIVFGCATVMGSASAPFKNFMESTAERSLRCRWADKVAAGFTADGEQDYGCKTTVVQLCSFAAEHSMLWVGGGIFVINEPAAERGEGDGAAGAGLGGTAPPGQAAAAKDGFATAEALGRRVAQVAQRWNWIRRFRSGRAGPALASERRGREPG